MLKKITALAVLLVLPLLASHKATDDSTRPLVPFKACEEGNEAIVRTFFDKHPECIDEEDEWNCTPLEIAATKFKHAVVKILIDRKATINPLRGFTTLLSTLDHYNHLCTRNQVTKQNHDDVVKTMSYLIRENPTCINFQRKCGPFGQPTALHLAISSGNLPCIRLLVENKADVNIKGDNDTPLDLALERASEKNNKDILIYLVRKGAKLSIDHANTGLFSKFLKIIQAKTWAQDKDAQRVLFEEIPAEITFARQLSDLYYNNKGPL